MKKTGKKRLLLYVLLTVFTMLPAATPPVSASGGPFTMDPRAMSRINFPTNRLNEVSDPFRVTGPSWTGDLTAIRKLLDAGTPIDGTRGNGRHLLTDAAAFGHLSVVRFLLSCHASVNVRGPSGQTALWSAADADRATVVSGPYSPSGRQIQTYLAAYLQIVQLLLAHGANPNIPDGFGVTPLDVAVFRERNATAAALLQAGADPNRRDPYGKTPLEWAAYQGNTQMVRLLQAYGAKVSFRRGLPGPAQRAKDEALLAALSTPGYDSDTNIIVIKRLLDQGADPNAWLVPVWDTTRPPELDELVSPSPRPDKNTFTLFLAHGAGVNIGGIHPYTVLLGPDPASTRLLLAYDAQHHGGRPHLMGERLLYAATLGSASNDLGQMHVILASRVPIHVPDTAFSMTHSEEALTLLMAHGLNINARDPEGQTRLMQMADEHWGEGDMAACDADWGQVLLRHGANPNLHDRNGNTPLMLLAAQGQYSGYNSGDPVKFARALLGHGASLGLRNKAGFTALQIADRCGAKSLSRLFRSRLGQSRKRQD